VLGPSQTEDLVDTSRAEALGIEVCRRRSGGGIVLVDPATSVWIDIVVPAGRRGPTSEPTRLFRWVGGVWLRALRRLGVDGLAVHEGRLTDRDHARLLCFAGYGPGEVLQRTPGGPSKVVGLSQRRTRTAARVQGLLLTGWEPHLLRDVVRPDAWPAGLDPADVRVGLHRGSVPTGPQVVDAVLACLVDRGTAGAGVTA
jgi:lipoate-protein ligase A